MTMPRRWRKMLEKKPKIPKIPELVDSEPSFDTMLISQPRQYGKLTGAVEAYAAEFVRIAKAGGTPLKVPPHLRTPQFLGMMEAKVKEMLA